MRTDRLAVQRAMAELADAAATAGDGSATRAALAGVVRGLERAAGSPLGAAEQDPLVVLQRRLGRAHRLLAGATRSTLSVGQVQAYVAAIRGASAERSPNEDGLAAGDRYVLTAVR